MGKSAVKTENMRLKSEGLGLKLCVLQFVRLSWRQFDMQQKIPLLGCA